MMRADVHLQPLRSEGPHSAAALELLRAGLGSGYIDEAAFRDYLAGQSDGIALGASRDDELVGVVLARVLDQPAAEERDALFRQADVAESLAGLRLGILKSIVVKPACRGQGVGSALTRAALDHLEQAGCDAILTVSWQSDAIESSAGMFERSGFQQVATVPEFWKEDSIRNGYDCPECGNPCTCAAFIYIYWRCRAPLTGRG